jgi:hypothetical protein
MFERYTEKARRVIFFARYEAGQYGSDAPHDLPCFTGRHGLADFSNTSNSGYRHLAHS